MGKLSCGKRACAVLLLGAAMATGLPAQTLTILYSFCSQGIFPYCTDGEFPTAGLLQGINGDGYGTTYEGGTGGGGTVFKITRSGTLTTIYNFCSLGGCFDGSGPAGLVQAANGYLYGTTGAGGDADGGTVFKVSPSGTLTTLYSFCSLYVEPSCPDGFWPWGGLVQATNGYLYGTTGGGGTNGYGTVFKITPSGTLTTLYSFCAQSGCTDGFNPYGALVQATNGYLYGTTEGGGANGNYGTVFKITPGGTLTTLYSFCAQSGCTDGENPNGALVQGTDGNLYGTAGDGGANPGPRDFGAGTVVKITPTGRLTTLYNFCSQSGCTDGEYPNAGLVQATNGYLYGTTGGGGANPGPVGGVGTVFSLSTGLGPFVKTLPTSGTVGAAVKILGTDLTGATSVTFNGTAAAFRVVSPSLITTTVPFGATTGTVQVVTPSGTLSGNGPFRVP